MLERLRQSLAFRLAIQYTLVFALGAAVLFGALYWRLTTVLVARDQAEVESRATELAAIYNYGGVGRLRQRLDRETSPEARSFFVRVLHADNEIVLVSVPPSWVELQTKVEQLPLPGFT